MRTLPAVLATLSLAVTGCAFSSIDPGEPVHITGRALDAEGQPLADTKVLLIKQADLGEVVFGAILAVGTLSAVCFTPEPPTICEKARTATTDDDGEYVFELEGDDTQGSLGTEATLSVVFSGKPGGSSTTLSFQAKEPHITLPDARLWKSGVKVTNALAVSWSPLPKSAGDKAAYDVQLQEAGTGTTLWTQTADGRSATVDPRVLEDRAGTVAVNGGTLLRGAVGTGGVRASYLSPRLPVTGTAGRPASRGRTCAAVTGTEPAADGAFGPCPLTDGDLGKAARLSGNGVTAGVVVDLGTQRKLRLVVARGFSGQVSLEVSRDGKTYRKAGAATGNALALVPAGQPTVRFVRLRSPTGLDQSLATELSVW